MPEICRPQTVPLIISCWQFVAWSLVAMHFTLVSSDSIRQVVPAFPFRIPCLLWSVQSWTECKRKMSVFQLMPLGKMLTDGTFTAHTEIAPGVERVNITLKAIKITDNCFLSYFLTWIKWDRIGGMLKTFYNSSLPCSLHPGRLRESFSGKSLIWFISAFLGTALSSWIIYN